MNKGREVKNMSPTLRRLYRNAFHELLSQKNSVRILHGGHGGISDKAANNKNAAYSNPELKKQVQSFYDAFKKSMKSEENVHKMKYASIQTKADCIEKANQVWMDIDKEENDCK